MMLATRRTNLAVATLVHLTVGTAALSLACTALAQSNPTPQLGVAPAAEAQAPSAPAPAQPPAAAPDVRQRPGANGPGLFSAIGRWIDNSLDTMASGLKDARNAVGDLGNHPAEAAAGATEPAKESPLGTVRIPTPAIVTGRQHCIRTANGGPDCLAASEVLCRQKGYAGGASLHIQSEQKCPVWGWVHGEKPVGECGTETYVTSAMCR
jgi:hypothetical protein